jgi:hypothetical protein
VTLEAQIRALADETAPIDGGVSKRLTDLAAAIQEPESHPGWVETDVYAVIRPEDAVNALRRAWTSDRSLAWLESLRNVLVLVPILLTWFGLMHASASYRALVERDPSQAQVPFLVLWEQGFPSEDGSHSAWSFLTFSHVAMADVAIVAIVIVITWFVHQRANLLQATREREANSLMQRLHGALAEATLTFGTFRAQQRNGGSEHVARMLLNELSAERARIAELSAERERETANLREFAHDIKDGAKGFGRHFGEMQSAMDTLADISARFSDQATDLATQHADLIAATKSLSHELAGFAGVQREALARLTAASDLLVENSTQTTANAALLRNPVIELRDQIRNLGEQLESERIAYERAASTSAEAAAEVTSALSAFRATASLLNALPTLSDTLNTAATQQQQTAGQLAESANSFQISARELSARMESGAEIFERLALALKQSIPTIERSHAVLADLAAQAAEILAAADASSEQRRGQPRRRWFQR